MVFSAFVFVGCQNVMISSTDLTTDTGTTTTEALMDYEMWLNSGQAKDYNNDRTIDEADYQIYQLYHDFEYWRQSSDAADFNDDQVINQEDYNVFRLKNSYEYWKDSDQAEDLNEDGTINESDYNIYINFDNWKNSDEAEDLNDDGIIDVEDFDIYQNFSEFAGEYYIANYQYNGSPNYGIGEDIDNHVKFSDLGYYLEQITFSINNEGNITVNIPSEVRDVFGQFGDLSTVIDEAIANMTITRISTYIAVIDTYATVDGVRGDFTLYLDTTENGYSTTYTISFYEDNPTISFDLIREE